MAGDEDKDGKLSKDELAKMDDRSKRWLENADGNSDGILERAEIARAAAAVAQKGGGKRGGGGSGGGPPGEPAGGGQ